jgi:uncharacterized membrane protein YoaK (UPF0700 family)
MTHHNAISVTPINKASESAVDYSPLLLLSFAAIAAHHLTKKQLRKAKSKMMWQVLKLKLKSIFSFKGKKEMSLQLKVFLIALLIGAAFGILLSFTAGLFAFVLSLLTAVVILFIKADKV